MAGNDLAVFYRLTKLVDDDEKLMEDAKQRLNSNYDQLVEICPHSEAVDRKSTIRRMGTTRCCKICGITDYASEGGTPGDEYNWGYPGSPNRSFWANATVETVDEKTFGSYSRYHQWVVKDGKPHKRFQ